MKHISAFPYVVTEQPNVGIVMPDGCRLSARVWMPDNAIDHPVPAIVEHLPYRKRDGTVHRDELNHPWFAGHGYACIRVDMRGNGDSEGLMTDEYTPQELQDACDVVAWASKQHWCNGRVGMMGISWGGFNSLQVAALQPPALKAIITLCSTVDRFADDIHYKGGCLLNENFAWASNMLSYSSRPPDPLLVGDTWRDLWLERLQHLPFLASVWLRHQQRDAYWQHGSVCENYQAINAAVLSIGGWHDGYRNTISHLVSNLSSPVKGIVGPWIHKYPHYAAPQPAIGFLQEALRWWDHWLKGEHTGIDADPAYRVWLMDSVPPARWLPERPGRWIAEASLPSARVKSQAFVLGDGILGESPMSTSVDIASVQNCGETTGEYFPFAFGPELPDEQSLDDARSCCFDSAALDAPMDIVGAPELDIAVAVDRPMALVAARLCDIRPDGTSALITMGVLNLTHRHSAERPELLVADESFNARVVLDHIAYRVPAGHRLRLALSTTYWPFVWPSPTAAVMTLASGSLNIPSRPYASQDEVSFAAPEAAPGWRSESLHQVKS